ncbi:protease inhibitor I42 family protein [Chloroflexota bacterium]
MQIALDFVENSQTYDYDGIKGSLELVNSLEISTPNAWTFIYRFESAHAGYGDRSQDVLAQVITPHVASVTVDNGEIVYARLDNAWDMINQEELFDDVEPVDIVSRDESDIVGIITEIEVVGGADVKGRILVELDIPNNTSDKFWVTITNNTQLFTYNGQDQEAEDFATLSNGQTVEVWFDGPVAESYPAQVTAGQVLLRTSTKTTTLEGNKWVLSAFGEEGSLGAVLDNTEITATFNQETGLVQGSSGCNTYGGAYYIQDNDLFIEEIEATEIGCVDPDGIMEQEQEYFRILLDAEEFQINDDILTISAGNNILLFTISEKNPEPVAGIVFEFSCDTFEETNVISLSYSPEIGINDTLSIVLCSNPTTGFRWSEAATIRDSTVVSQVDHSYAPPEPGSGVGAAGVETFTFQGLKPGMTNISMSYGRPWEEGEKGAWIFDITVVVK